MSDEPNSFSALLDRVAQGDEGAAQELVEHYREPLIRVIRRRLRSYPKLRRLFDSIDFLQDTWRVILEHPEKLRDFGTFNELMRHLASMANHRVQHARRHYLDAQKRNLRRDCSLSDPDIASVALTQSDPQRDPGARAAFYDLWVRWLRSLSKPQRIVALLLRNGSTHSEIAEQMDCSVRTIERMVTELRAKASPEMSL
jgi:RNA polymerase sigma factor (sigma-70 family)